MPKPETKGITVRVDAGLHAEIRAYLEASGMTMGEFIALAAWDELHPKTPEMEGNRMERENMRTGALSRSSLAVSRESTGSGPGICGLTVLPRRPPA